MKFYFLIISFIIPQLIISQSADSIIYAIQIDSLIALSSEKTDAGEHQFAEEFNQMAYEITLEKFGENSLQFGAVTFNFGRVYYFVGKPDQAENYYLKSLNNRANLLGTNHPLYAKVLNNLAYLYKDKGQYEKAEELFSKVLDIFNKNYGEDSEEYTLSLNNLAALYLNTGQYEKAEPLFIQCKEFHEKKHGQENANFISSINNLAITYMELCRYDKAEPLYILSKNLREKILGNEHPKYATSLNNLALLYSNIGQFEKAEPLYLQSISIREKVLGHNHPDYATAINNLAILYMNMGIYPKAEAFFLEAKNIREKSLGKDHPDYITCLNNLGLLYMYSGQYPKAEEYLLETKSAREKILGIEHQDYNNTLFNLADLYFFMGQYAKAEKYFLETKSLREKLLGNNHLDYISCLYNLAILYIQLHQYDKAKPLLLESESKWKKLLGDKSRDYALSLKFLARLYEESGEKIKAERKYIQLFELNEKILSKAAEFLSEGELSYYIKDFSESQDRCLSFAGSVESKILPSICYNNSLFYKGFLLNSSGSLRKIAVTHSETKEKYETLKSYQIRLASLYSLPIQERDSALILNLESKSDQLEKELTRILSPYSEAHRQITWRDIQKKLKKNEVAIEFVHYTYYQRSDTVTTKYSAILITSAAKQPKYISLFDEHQLEFSKLNNKNILTSYSSRGAIPSQGQTTPLDLYELIWKPLMPYLNKINTIYYSPSGVLHRINLDAIPMFGMTLSDQYKLIRVNSTRNLVRSDQNQTKVLKDAILFGGIEYDLDSTENILARNKIVSQQKFKKKIQIESSTKDIKWNYLPGTSEEVKEIKKQLDNSNISTTLYSGIQASEENFKSIGISSPSPQILHLATHGFFFPDPKKETQTIKSINTEVIFQTSQHPMMRSGLLMAGANYAWKVGKPINSETEDGILTAYEISQMNLSNTELVILSACETGLGEIQGNEGVYGLQRAFKMAGVKYIIMSLWQVPDKQTSLLMTTFYKKWLENQLSIPNAFQAAQKELRLSGLDPVQWAGFILVE